jgi:hypothetical protein
VGHKCFNRSAQLAEKGVEMDAAAVQAVNEQARRVAGQMIS